MKLSSERLQESKEQKKNKGSVLVAESAYNAQNAQFGLVMKVTEYLKSGWFFFLQTNFAFDGFFNIIQKLLLA